VDIEVLVCTELPRPHAARVPHIDQIRYAGLRVMVAVMYRHTIKKVCKAEQNNWLKTRETGLLGEEISPSLSPHSSPQVLHRENTSGTKKIHTNHTVSKRTQCPHYPEGVKVAPVPTADPSEMSLISIFCSTWPLRTATG
jgi:hypothetical protein